MTRAGDSGEFGRVALLQGGQSPEREVSLASGANVLRALQNLGCEPLVLDPARDVNWLGTLIEQRITRVFNILHGGGGEDGSVRGAIESAGIACTGSGVLGSALAMNKPVTKQIWRQVGIPTADWRVANSAADAAAIARELPPPWFVKPASGGSSTHSAVARSAEELPAAIETALREGCALVERLIEGVEYTMSVVDNAPLPLIKIVPAQPYYDYHAKYESDKTAFFCPCGLPAPRERELRDLAMRAYFALHCESWGRVDFILDAEGAVWFFEVNTVPGMTSHSLVPMAAAAAGMDFEETVRRILLGAGGGA